MLRPRLFRPVLKLTVLVSLLLLTYRYLPDLLPSVFPPSPSADAISAAVLALEKERSSWSAAHGVGGGGAKELGLGLREVEGARERVPQGAPPPKRPQPPPWAELEADKEKEKPAERKDRGGFEAREKGRVPPRPGVRGVGGETYEEEVRAFEAKKLLQNQGQAQKADPGRDEVAAAAQAPPRGVKVPHVAMADPRHHGGDQGGESDGVDDELTAIRKVRQKPAYFDEDDELDAAQKGDGGARVAAAGSRKKGPLIQVGGAEKAAGGDWEPREKDEVGDDKAEKGKDMWRGAGWDQRFKKLPLAMAEDKEREPVEKDAKGDEAADRVDHPARPAPPKAKSPPDENNNGNDDASDTKRLLRQHPLVARFVHLDLSHSGTGDTALPQAVFEDPHTEDSFQADSAPSKPGRHRLDLLDGAQGERHNLTVCALIPNEQRFLSEWLLYHSLLGVSRFSLYDTSLPGAFGAAEVDALADKMQHEAGGHESGPTVEELKAQVGYSDAGRDGLDEKGVIRRERIKGLEDWIETGRVRMHWIKFKDPKAPHDVHALMLDHCTSTYGPSSAWLAHLDVDEFLSLSTPLYGSDEPYTASTATSDHVYPLHDLLALPALNSAACIPLPELDYRNLGVRELKKNEGVLETQVHRDVLRQGKKQKSEGEGLQQKTLIHTAFSSKPIVSFAGPHSCKVLRNPGEVDILAPDGVTGEIKDSQGAVLQDRDGVYYPQKLPMEPLAIAHYLQRDLLDCHSKLSSLADPLSLLPKGRGSLACETHYLPSPLELGSPAWVADDENEYLRRVPPPGSVVEDRRMERSWAARAAKAVAGAWRSERNHKGSEAEAEARARGERARGRVEVLTF
ncbi:hypothetical protein JCM1840_006146 [Sporobolomyces johnsonii]